MKCFLRIFIILIFLVSCNSKEDKKSIFESTKDQVDQYKNQKKSNTRSKKDSLKIQQELLIEQCDIAWKRLQYLYSKKDSLIDRIIFLNKDSITEKNLRFINRLRISHHESYTLNKPISAVFRFSKEEVGLLSNTIVKMTEKGSMIEFFSEDSIIKKYDTLRTNFTYDYGFKVLKNAINELNYDSLEINIIGKDFKRKSKVLELGRYIDECLEYSIHTIDTINISINDKVLLSSPYDLDIEFTSNSKVDSLLQNNFINKCNDCITSYHLEKTFAYLKGVDNIYFTYADTFPYNNELETPSRGIVYVNENNEIINIWGDSVDFFGCSCL